MQVKLGELRRVIREAWETEQSSDSYLDVRSKGIHGYTVKMTPSGHFEVRGRTSGRVYKRCDDEDSAWQYREQLEAARRYAKLPRGGQQMLSDPQHRRDLQDRDRARRAKKPVTDGEGG